MILMDIDTRIHSMFIHNIWQGYTQYMTWQRGYCIIIMVQMYLDYRLGSGNISHLTRLVKLTFTQTLLMFRMFRIINLEFGHQF